MATRLSLNKKLKGNDNLARDTALYFLRLHRSESLSVIGSYLNIESYSTVSGILLRFKKRLKNDSGLQGQVRKIEEKL